MENAVDALKIAFGVMMFVLALTLSISSFSSANSTVKAIVQMNDRETEYTYIEPSKNRTRTVGIETIVPTMYRAYYENTEIKFFDSDGTTALTLYKRKNADGSETSISSIDMTINSDIELVDSLLGGVVDSDKYSVTGTESAGGLYNYLSDKKFIENLGEYYQDDSQNTPQAMKVKKRVITYTLIN